MSLDLGDGIALRQATEADHAALSLICLRTGAAGEDATDREDDPSLLGLIYAVPYQVLEPDLAYVVTADGEPRGYVLGALDTASFNRRMKTEWVPALQRRVPPPPRDRSLWSGSDWARHLIHNPVFDVPPEIAAYPSHAHIDLLPDVRGRGIGRRIMGHLEDRLRAAGSLGLHLSVDPRNMRALGFYEALGFVELTRSPGTLVMAKRL